MPLPFINVDTVKEGVVFVPFHYGTWENNEAANELTADFTDPLSKQPTFKHASCRIETLRKRYEISSSVTLQHVANENRLTLEELARINRMIPPYRADIGREVEVPLSRVNVEIPPYMPYRNIEKFPHFKQSNLPYTRLDTE